MGSKPLTLATSLLALAIICITGALDFYTLANGLPHEQSTDNVVVMILTAWNGLCLAVSGYFFGSSLGSDRKSELLAASSPGPTVSVKGNETTVQTSPASGAP